MQIRMRGSDNKGKTLFIHEHDEISHKGLASLIQTYNEDFPSAICVDIQIAYPDPEVVAIKKDMLSLIRNIGQTDDDIVNALWNTFNIKRRD